MKSKSLLFCLYLIISSSILEIKSQKPIPNSTMKVVQSTSNKKLMNSNIVLSKTSINPIKSKSHIILKSKTIKTRTKMMSPDAIMMITALALDVATVLINLAAKFVEGKIYQQKMKIVTGVQQLFFDQMAVKENLCYEFLSINDVYGDLLVSLKLQYIADQIFLTACQSDPLCYEDTKTNYLPKISLLLDSTIKMKEMVDRTIGIARSMEDMLCSKTIDFVGEINYIHRRSSLTVGVNPGSSDTISEMLTTVTWNAVAALITAIQKGGVFRNFSLLFEVAGNLKEIGVDGFKKAKELLKVKLGIDSFTDSILSKIDPQFKEWKLYKKFPFIMETFKDVTYDVMPIITSELNLAAGIPEDPPATVPVETDAFVLDGGKLTVTNECVKLPIAGCTPDEWLASLKQVVKVLKVIFNRDNWENNGPSGILNIAGSFLFLGLFGVKLYYFINSIVKAGGSPWKVNEEMTAAAAQFWYKTIEFIEELVLIQAKVWGVSKEKFVREIEEHPDATEFSKAQELKSVDKKYEEAVKEAKAGRRKVIKSYLSALSAFILLPLIKKGAILIIGVLGEEFVKNYLWQAIAAVKLVYSIYKFSLAIYNLVKKIIELKKWEKEANEEVDLQNVYKDHLTNQANYIKCKYLLYLWNIFEEHSRVANENVAKTEMKLRYIASLRFKELNSKSTRFVETRTKFRTRENPCDKMKLKIATEEDRLTPMTELEFQCSIADTLSIAVGGRADDAEDTESKTKGNVDNFLANEIKSVCQGDPGFCKNFFSKQIWDSLAENGIEIEKRISYALNFGPITTAVVVNKKKLIFSGDFLSKRGYHFYRDKSFSEDKAIMYSRRPTSKIAINAIEKKTIDLETSGNFNQLFDHKLESFLLQYEIVNDILVPKKDPKKKDKEKVKNGKFNAMIIGYAKIPDAEESETIPLLISFNPKYGTSTKDWNINKFEWDDFGFEKGEVVIVEDKDPGNLGEGSYLLDAYLIPSSRQFDEKWIYYMVTPSGLGAAGNFYSIIDNRFVNDWNSNENLMEDSKKVLTIFETPINKYKGAGATGENSEYVIDSDLCGKTKIPLNSSSEMKSNEFTKFSEMGKIYKKRGDKMNIASKSIQKALCKINCYYKSHKKKFLEKEEIDDEEKRLVTGGYDLEVKYNEKGNIISAKFSDKHSSSINPPQLIVITLRKSIVPALERYLIAHLGIKSPDIFSKLMKEHSGSESLTFENENYPTFDKIQNHYLNPYSYMKNFGEDIEEDFWYLINSGINFANEEDMNKEKFVKEINEVKEEFKKNENKENEKILEKAKKKKEESAKEEVKAAKIKAKQEKKDKEDAKKQQEAEEKKRKKEYNKLSDEKKAEYNKKQEEEYRKKKAQDEQTETQGNKATEITIIQNGADSEVSKKKEVNVYTAIRQIRDKNIGVLFLHHSFPPSDDSLLKGETIFPELGIIYRSYEISQNFAVNLLKSIVKPLVDERRFHLLMPFYMDPSVYFVTVVLGSVPEGKKEKEMKLNTVFQLQTRDRINDDVIYKVPYSSLNYIEVKVTGVACKAPDVSDTLGLATLTHKLDKEEEEEEKKKNYMLDLGYLPTFPPPKTAVDDFISPNNFFFSFSFEKNLCFISRFGCNIITSWKLIILRFVKRMILQRRKKIHHLLLTE